MRKPLRLMHITHDLAIGGLQQVIVNLCRTLDQENFHITVLCLCDLGPLAETIQELGIKVILLPGQEGRTDYFSFIKVARILKKEKIDVIHTHNTQPLVDGTLGAVLAGGMRRIIHTDHARQFPDKVRYMFAEWCMSHRVHRMVGVSEQTTLNLRRYEKIPQKKLMTIENGIDGSRFDAVVDVENKRRALGLPSAGPLIGVISRLEAVKGITWLLQAMPDIIQRFPNLILLIVGEGTCRRDLEAETEQLGLHDHVVFTGARRDVPEILPLLDIYLLPSLSEGLPMGLLEAMAAGCPVIASAVGGIPAVVTNSETGVLVAPADSSTLARAVMDLVADPKGRARMSRCQKKLFYRHYRAAIMTRKYCRLYSP